MFIVQSAAASANQVCAASEINEDGSSGLYDDHPVNDVAEEALGLWVGCILTQPHLLQVCVLAKRLFGHLSERSLLLFLQVPKKLTFLFSISSKHFKIGMHAPNTVLTRPSGLLHL